MYSGVRPRFRKSLDLQFSSLVGYFTKTKAFIAYFTCFNEVFTINGVYIKAFDELKMT